MNGLIALVGAGEYLPVMNEVDRHLLASVNTNGRDPARGLFANRCRAGRR